MSHARTVSRAIARSVVGADARTAVDRLWLPGLCVALFLVTQWAFHHWLPKVWYGDDLSNYLAFRHHSFASSLDQALFQSSADKYRPVFQLLMYALFSAFGAHLGGYLAFNIALNVANGLMMALIAYRLSGRRKVVAALAALITAGSRLSLYQVTQVTGILEGVGCLLFLATVLAIVELHAAAPGRRGVRLGALAVGALWLSVFDHERYLAMVPWVALMVWAAPGLRDAAARWRLGLPLLACAALPVNAGYKAFVLRQPLLVGTGGAHFAFDPAGYVDRASQGFLSILGLNTGPGYLVGHPIVGSPVDFTTFVAAAMVLLLASIIGLQLRTVRRHPARGPGLQAYLMPAAFAVLIGLLFVPPILTVRIEQRWEVEPFALVVMIACWFAGRLAEHARGLALGLFAALTATSLGLDHRVSGDFPRVFMIYSESVARSIKTQIVDPRRSAAIVADAGICQWAVLNGASYDLYAPGWPHPQCVTSFNDLPAEDLLEAHPRPAIFALQPGQAIVKDISDAAYDELEQRRDIRRFDFIGQFSQGRINDSRPIQTPTGKGVLILPVDTASGARPTLTVVSGFAYRYDHLQAAPGDRLKFSALMVYPMPTTSRAIVTVITASGAQTTVFDKLLPVRPAKGDPTAVRADIPLDKFGRNFSVVFSVVTPGTDPSAQWVAFDAPRIVHAPG